MKVQDAPPQVREWFRLFLNFTQSGHDVLNVFDDFLTLVCCVYAWQTKEEEYLNTIKRYSRDDVDRFVKLLSELIILYGTRVDAKKWADPLGEIYETLASNYKKSALGQFFTPPSVCDMMAKMQVKPSDSVQTVYDPCIGSGRTALAASRLNSNIIVFGEDIDPICCKMAALNLMFHGVKAQVVQMDSILRTDYRKGFVINWNYKDSKVWSCLDLPQEKSYSYTMNNKPKSEPKAEKQISIIF